MIGELEPKESRRYVSQLIFAEEECADGVFETGNCVFFKLADFISVAKKHVTVKAT